MESWDANSRSDEQQRSQSPKAIVCIYAQRDEALYRELQAYLVLWQKQGRIYWADRASVHQADLILLLTSPSFFAATVCHTAMVSAFEVRAQRGIPVVPVLARASDWKESDCGALKALPDNDLPIAEWEQQERAYENICAGLARLLPDLPPLGGQAPPERLRIFQARDLPKIYVPRPTTFQNIKSKLLTQRDSQATALRGAGGFGKTTLALALCHDSEIQAAFPDGLLWVELGERPPRTLDLLNSLLASLETPHTGAITLEEARERWRKALRDRVCLLVIDDVWQASAMAPFLENGPQCVRLITTRNDQVLPEEAVRVWVDAMEPAEAMALLCHNMPEEIMYQEVYQPQLKALVKRLGGWPLLLALARGMLLNQLSNGKPLFQALSVVEQAYQKRGVVAFRLDNASERQRTVEACLEVSLHHLAEFTPSHYHAIERYQELAVFPEDTDIPLATLQTYWQGTGKLENWETEDLCICLHNLSLLLTCDLDKSTIRLHDVLCSYLVQCVKPNLLALHTRFLDVSQQVLGLKCWADLSLDNRYLWQHVIWHQCQASSEEQLQVTLTDLWYLIRKALYVGVPSLEADFLLASTFSPATSAEPTPSFFVSLYRMIVRISHLLQQAHTPSEMGGLLLSYLGWEPAFIQHRLPLERELPRPFLTAWHPLPSGSSTALLCTLHGHTIQVHGCAVSPDSRFIVSASGDHTLKIWDAATGMERFTLKGHTDKVYGCAVSPDGRFVISASDDGTLKIWDAATGVQHLSLYCSAYGCVVSPDNRFIATASVNQTLKVWNTTIGARHLSLLDYASGDRGCVVSPDGRFIISAFEGKTLKAWDIATARELFTLHGHTDLINGYVVSPNSCFIVSASEDNKLKVWDATTGEERFTLHGHTKAVTSCAVSPNSRFIVSASFDKTLKIWDVATGKECLTLHGHTDRVQNCAISPDGRFIVSASADLTLKVWDTTIEAQHLSLQGHTDKVRGCAVSPNGRFVISASENNMLKVWDAATRNQLLSLKGDILWTTSFTSCAVSPNGRFIVSASSDGKLRVWNVATGKEHLILKGHNDEITSCAVSPTGRFIVSASFDRTLKVWDASTGKERFTLSGHTNAVTDCAISPDGRFIVSASYDKTLKIWDVATGRERFTLNGHTYWVLGCAASPDGRFIVSASEDETLKVWDTVTGAQRLSLHGHTGWVTGCMVSPDGRFIVSVSEDKTLKVWNAQTGQCLLTFPVDGPLSGCAFHPDGEHLVACGDQGVYFLRLVR